MTGRFNSRTKAYLRCVRKRARDGANGDEEWTRAYSFAVVTIRNALPESWAAYVETATAIADCLGNRTPRYTRPSLTDFDGRITRLHFSRGSRIESRIVIRSKEINIQRDNKDDRWEIQLKYHSKRSFTFRTMSWNELTFEGFRVKLSTVVERNTLYDTLVARSCSVPSDSDNFDNSLISPGIERIMRTIADVLTIR